MHYQEAIFENIVRNVVIDDDSKQRDRVLSDDERSRFLEACRESQWNKLYLLVLCAVTTGARKSELLGLRWKDIDFKNSLATLHDTKNGTARTLSFPVIVMTELKKF